jgi:hypothetical protein
MSKIKISIVGNCQVRPLAKAINKLAKEVDINAIAVVQTLNNGDYSSYNDHFESADYIISQLVFDSYPCEFVRTGFLKEKYGHKVISIVNLYFTGYTPEWVYIHIPNKGNLNGPMGPYHNKTILEAWKNKLSIEEAIDRVTSTTYNEKFIPEINKSLNELKRREEMVDIPIVDYIKENMYRERLFFTFNHPADLLTNEYAKRIIEHLKKDINESEPDELKAESLNQFIPLVNCGVGLPDNSNLYKGVEFSLDKNFNIITSGVKTYNIDELVSCFYQIYWNNKDKLIDQPI